jgi:hypothetical protein
MNNDGIHESFTDPHVFTTVHYVSILPQEINAKIHTFYLIGRLPFNMECFADDEVLRLQ